VEESPRPAALRLEALDLQTDAGYESLHCYAALGDRPPRWYPDADGDPGTDESFAALSGTHWDIAAHFSGSEAPVVFWPGDADLPFDITCVGVRAGGRMLSSSVGWRWPSRLPVGRRAQAGECRRRGQLRAGIPGRLRRPPAQGTRLQHGGAPEPSLRRPPTVAALGLHPNTEPEAEAEIDGFLVFLNENLVFEVAADERESRLPEAWLVPPCGEEYVFSLRAFHRPYPDGAYSNPSNELPIAGGEPGSEACEREFLVTFRR